MTSLRWAHTHCGEPLHELDVAIAHARGIDDIFNLKILVKVDKFPTFGVLYKGPWMVNLLVTGDVLICSNVANSIKIQLL